MVRFQETGDFLRVCFLTALVLASILVLTFLGSCSDSTDPVINPEDLNFTYTPNDAVLISFPGEDVDFSVAISPEASLQYQWWLNEENSGGGKLFHYTANSIGLDTLRLDMSYMSADWSRTWYIDVQEDALTVPPAVPAVIIGHGDEAADVEVSWRMIPQSTFQVVEYLVVMSYEGPITTDNWQDGILLGVYPHLYNQVGHSITYSEDDGMQSGEPAWFAVRGVDSVGQLSILPPSHEHLISSPWYIEGIVYDESGHFVPNVIIDYGCTSCRVNADSEGHFIIGPVPNVNSYDLYTLTEDTDCNGEPCNSFYDFYSRDVQYDQIGNYDIVLVSRYGLDDGCHSYDHKFLNYLRYMTKTNVTSSLRPNFVLYKWETYPVTVYIPSYSSNNGLDFQSLCQDAVDFWNTAMGEVYLVLVDSAEEAMIEFLFFEDDRDYYGKTFLLEPSDQQYRLSDVIPEKIKVEIWAAMSVENLIQQTAMHELGHSLGLVDHTLCTGGGFLMAYSPYGLVDHEVHIDEIRAVRAIRNLHQGTNMADFETP